MLKKLAVGVAALVAVLLIVIATRPSAFHIERSTQIQAPAAIVFPLVNDLQRWPAWSPWEKRDPGMKREYSGTAVGVGATYGWSGNDEVGEGRMTIVESRPEQRVGIELEFIKPFAATNRATFSFAPAAGGTVVTWAMDGNNDFMGKAVSLFMDMDSMVGSDFEAGLRAMKQAAEGAAGIGSAG